MVSLLSQAARSGYLARLPGHCCHVIMPDQPCQVILVCQLCCLALTDQALIKLYLPADMRIVAGTAQARLRNPLVKTHCKYLSPLPHSEAA